VGSFYTNITLRVADRDRVRRHLVARGLSAFLSRPEAGSLVVFERSSESQDPDVVDEVAANLSDELRCSALAVTNHDDSVLVCVLFDGGRLIDEYNSAPEYFGEEVSYAAQGGDAERISLTLGVPDRAAQVAAVLAIQANEEGLVFETDRHAQLVESLGLPKCAVGAGYEYLRAGEYPSGYGPDDFERVGED
jgi:hypothetical protein